MRSRKDICRLSFRVRVNKNLYATQEFGHALHPVQYQRCRMSAHEVRTIRLRHAAHIRILKVHVVIVLGKIRSSTFDFYGYRIV